MKIINLDKFRIQTAVELQGVTYTIEGRTVEDFLANDLDERMAGCSDEKEKTKLMVSELEKITTIPKEVLMKQHFPVLHALLQIINGIDPESQAQAPGNV
jgi:hypothetical protein